jgi:hypothetical protein
LGVRDKFAHPAVTGIIGPLLIIEDVLAGALGKPLPPSNVQRGKGLRVLLVEDPLFFPCRDVQLGLYPVHAIELGVVELYSPLIPSRAIPGGEHCPDLPGVASIPKAVVPGRFKPGLGIIEIKHGKRQASIVVHWVAILSDLCLAFAA